MNGVNTWTIIRLQAKQSSSLIISVLILMISLLYSIANLSLLSVSFVLFGTYLFIFVFGIIVTNALHESAHFDELDTLGYEIGKIAVHRIGNVSFSIIDQENMTPEQNYVVSKAPFAKISHLAIHAFLLVLLILTNIMLAFPLNLLVIFLTLLAILDFAANVCAIHIIRTQKISGICTTIAHITSQEDIDDILAWNRLVHGNSE